MKNQNRRTLLAIVILFEIAIFFCDFTEILLLPNPTIKSIEFALFAVISITAMYTLHRESKNDISLEKSQIERNKLKTKLKNTELEFEKVKKAANKTNTSPTILRQIRRDERKHTG